MEFANVHHLFSYPAMALVLRLRCEADYRTWLTYDAYSGCLCCGMMRQRGWPPMQGHWEWFLIGVPARSTVMRVHGTEATLEEAQAAFKAAWLQWLELAGLQEREVCCWLAWCDDRTMS